MRFFKWLGLGLVVLVGLLAVALLAIWVLYPKQRAPSAERVQSTPEKVERGRYLFQHVAACGNCHTPSDYTAFAAPQRADQTGAGKCFPEAFQLPGKVCPPNITPHPTAGVGRWTDGELLRAIREGVGRDGRALFMMDHFPLSDPDAEAVVAYLRSLAPLDSAPERTQLIFPMSIVNRLFPKPLEGAIAAPSASSGVAYGRYLVAVASCSGCHGGSAGDFAGGATFGTPAGEERAPDITGLRNYSKEAFVTLIKSYASASPASPPARLVMPWRAFSGMTEADLGSVYDYLETTGKEGR